MWEYCVAFKKDCSAEHFKNNIKQKIKKHNGVVTSIEDEVCVKVLIAIPIIERFKIHNYLREKIAEIILLNYKKEYILSKLNFNPSKEIDMQIFLKALTVFDSDTDKEIIMERLKFDNSLYIDSFINFKLSFLKRKWDELISLANDNALYLINKESFLELIKFLISNLEYRYCTVNVFSKKDCYLLYDQFGNSIEDFLIEKSILYDNNTLLTSLVALNPERIVFHCKENINEHLVKDLYDLFSNRIQITKK